MHPLLVLRLRHVVALAACVPTTAAKPRNGLSLAIAARIWRWPMPCPRQITLKFFLPRPVCESREESILCACPRVHPASSGVCFKIQSCASPSPSLVLPSIPHFTFWVPFFTSLSLLPRINFVELLREIFERIPALSLAFEWRLAQLHPRLMHPRNSDVQPSRIVGVKAGGLHAERNVVVSGVATNMNHHIFRPDFRPVRQDKVAHTT